MILAPRFLPRLAATVGLFTRYGLRDFARQQGLIELSPDEAAGPDATEGDGAWFEAPLPPDMENTLTALRRWRTK